MKLPERSKQTATMSQEAPETTNARREYGSWLAEANEKIRRILVSDQALMDQARNRIVSKLFAARRNGRSIGQVADDAGDTPSEALTWGKELDRIEATLSDEDRARVVSLYERKRVARDQLANGLGIRNGEAMAALCERTRYPLSILRQTAATMAHVGVLRQSPGMPVADTKRRPMTEDAMAERERQADLIAAGMVDG